MFWGTGLVPVGYWKSRVEGICSIMLQSCQHNPCLCCTVAKFFTKALRIPEYLPASVGEGAGGKVYSTLTEFTR